jgi:ribosome recycling factor
MIKSIDEAKQQMSRAMEHFDAELNKIRTGRANASILEGVKVTVYGQETPLMHIANVNALDAQTLQITPFDPNNLEAISAAIREDQ